jgi:hypothetical protein
MEAKKNAATRRADVSFNAAGTGGRVCATVQAVSARVSRRRKAARRRHGTAATRSAGRARALCLPSDAGGSHPYVAFFRGLRHPSRLRGVRTRHPLTSARLREMTEQRSAGRKRLRRTGNTTFGWTGKRHFEFSTTRQRLQIYTWSDSDPRPPVMHRRVVWIQGSALVGNRFVFLTSASRPSIATDHVFVWLGVSGRNRPSKTVKLNTWIARRNLG